MFTDKQKTWIVFQYGSDQSPASLRRKFLLEYGIKGRRAQCYQSHLFTRVVENFKEKGIGKGKKSGRPISKRTPEAKLLVVNELKENPMQSVRKIARKLNFETSTTYNIIKHELKFKPYKLHRCQQLTEDHKSQRVGFCQWFSENNIDAQNVIFTDEKWFTLRPHLNRQNTRFWSIENPYAYDDCIRQGAEKVMCWAAIVDGKVLPLVWFDAGTSVNSDKYLSVLKENLWPEVKSLSTRRQYFYQQDGAPCHCSNKCLEYLQEKFNGRIISRRTDIFWPAHSPDLSPLDYWFWGIMEEHIARQQPETLAQLKMVVEEHAAAMDPVQVRLAVENIRKRISLCAANNGGHFEARL